MGLWARIFAATYEQGSGRAERAGLGEARATLLRGVEGRVLEIGAGTGWNVVRYPPGSNVTYTEPKRWWRISKLAALLNLPYRPFHAKTKE